MKMSQYRSPMLSTPTSYTLDIEVLKSGGIEPARQAKARRCSRLAIALQFGNLFLPQVVDLMAQTHRAVWKLRNDLKNTFILCTTLEWSALAARRASVWIGNPHP